MITADFISGSRDIMQDLISSVLILIHSADVCILVMVCLDCARMCSEKPFPASLTIHVCSQRGTTCSLSCTSNYSFSTAQLPARLKLT